MALVECPATPVPVMPCETQTVNTAFSLINYAVPKNGVHSTGVYVSVYHSAKGCANSSQFRCPSFPSTHDVRHLPKYPMSSISNAASTSSNFQTIFNSALAKYTKQTGKDLRNHPLAYRIDSCNSPDSILDIFQEQSRAFDEFRKGDTKLFQWLIPVVNVLHALSSNPVLRDSGSLVSPPTFLAIHTIS